MVYLHNPLLRAEYIIKLYRTLTNVQMFNSIPQYDCILC